MAGDANLDGKVDFADFVIVSNHYGQAGGWTEGNFTGGPTVDFASYVSVSNNYGKTYDVSEAANGTYEDSGLQAGTTYYYRISPISLSGLSGVLFDTAVTTLTVVADAVVFPAAPEASNESPPAAPASLPASTPTPTPTPTAPASTVSPSTDPVVKAETPSRTHSKPERHSKFDRRFSRHGHGRW
jgi:hypothetical protein